MAEIETVEPAEQPAARLGELQDGDAPAWLSDAHHLGQAAIRVRDVAQAERHCRYLKVVIRKRQPLCVGFQITDTIGSLLSVRFLASQDEHFVTKVSADDRNLAVSR